MSTRVVEAPAPVVTWVEAQAHLRLDGDDEKAYVEALIAAATAWLDGPAGWLGRAIGTQKLETDFDSFDCSLDLMPPVREDVSVRYVAPDGEEQELAETVYRVVGPPSRPRVVPRHGLGFPSARSEHGAVRICYGAGYEMAPAPIKQAILLLVGQWFDTRAAVNVGNIINEMPFAVEALLSTFRVMR